MEVAPGIHLLRIPIPGNALGILNSYLIQGSRGCILVDAGWSAEESLSSLLGQLHSLGVRPGDIKAVILTHTHADHYGLAAQIASRYECPLAFHLWEQVMLEWRYVRTPAEIQRMASFLCTNGMPMARAEFPTQEFWPLWKPISVTQPDQVLYGGEVFDIGGCNIEVLWTPGHSPGHICLYEQDRRVLFSGDHVLPGVTPNVSPHPQIGNNPLGNFLDSLQSLRNLPVDMVLPAHEMPFTNLPARIAEISMHHAQRSSEVLAVLDHAPSSAYEVAERLMWKSHEQDWADWPPTQQRLAVLETIAHLAMLRMEGKVRRYFDAERIARYVRA